MGWFEDQIKERKKKDKEFVEDSMYQIAKAILGSSQRVAYGEKRDDSLDAIKDVLNYYHYKNVDIPNNINIFDDQLEWAFRPHGVMRRNVVLSEGWSNKAFGVMIGFFEDGGKPVALIPKGIRGYYYYDSVTHKKVSINSRNEDAFSSEAICFYKPLPLRKLTIADLLIYIKDCISPGDIFFYVLTALIITLFGLLIPGVTAILTGPIKDSNNMRLLAGSAVFIICITITTQLLTAMKNLILTSVTEKTSLQVEAAVMMRLMSLPTSFFRKFNAGELATRVECTNELSRFIIEGIYSATISAIMSLLYIFEVEQFAPSLVMPALTIIILLVLTCIAASITKSQITEKRIKIESHGMGLSYSLISGIEKIRITGAEKRAFAKWVNHFATEATYIYNPPFIVKVYPAIVTGILLIGNVVLYQTAAKNNVSQSDFYAFLAAFSQMVIAFTAFSEITETIAQVRPMLKLSEPILEEEPELSEEEEVLTKLSGNIELSNVCFKYQDNFPFVINNLSLKIKSGEYVAIVGETGCGKSTLIRLLLGFETAQKGAIYFDGRDIRSIEKKSLRRRIGAVLQNDTLLQGDIYSNIALSKPGLSVEDAFKAADIAGIGDDIRSMPMGMHTLCSEGHGGISGGQKQRLLIARAIAPKPNILIFDEATSALDNITQKRISDALDSLKSTRIVIAHRLSTIRNCDRILVLRDGKIVEEGSYQKLVENGGYFMELVERQMA